MEAYAMKIFVLALNYFTEANTVIPIRSVLCLGCDAVSIKASTWSW